MTKVTQQVTPRPLYTEAELEELRDALKARYAELEKLVKRQFGEARKGEHVSKAESDWGNAGQETTEFRLLTNKTREMIAIEQALGRLEVGNYGICQDCGEPIGIPRLKAKPFTKLCIDCKRQEDEANSSIKK